MATNEQLDRLFRSLRLGADDVRSLAGLLYSTKERVYKRTLRDLSKSFEYTIGPVVLSNEVTDALRKEARAHAVKITATYNSALDNFLGEHADEGVRELRKLVKTWTNARSRQRSNLVAVTEAYGPHADATVSFFKDNGIDLDFDFGGHGDQAPVCMICRVLKEGNPHSLARVIAIGAPHPRCRQRWHPKISRKDLPDELTLGEKVAGIVGKTTLIERQGGLDGAVKFVRGSS